MKNVGNFLLEKGWRARERAMPFWFAVSWFLLQTARLIFRVVGDDYGLSEALNHLGILSKLRARRLLRQAVSYHRRAGKVRETTATWLNLAGVLIDSGLYEAAQAVLLRAIAGYTDNSAARGNARSHLSLVLLRCGQLENAVQQNAQALAEIGECWEEERLPHKAIWKCSALMTKARIQLAQGDQLAAVDTAEAALALSQEYHLVERTHQTKDLLAAIKGV